jgi:ATP-dependent Clp protease ATP-binding subunit ClpC
MVKEIGGRLAEQKIRLEVKKRAREWLIEKGFDEKFGARPLRRLLQKEVEDPLSVEILKGRFSAGDTVEVELRNEKIAFRRRGEKPELPESNGEPALLEAEKGPVAVEETGGDPPAEPGREPEPAAT